MWPPVEVKVDAIIAAARRPAGRRLRGRRAGGEGWIMERLRAGARDFAAKHGIARMRDSYEALIVDPEVDAIYNPLPNSLHAPWTLRAIAAGKHVLCEKPFTSNEAEAAEVAEAATSAGVVVMEALHYRY